MLLPSFHLPKSPLTSGFHSGFYPPTLLQSGKFLKNFRQAAMELSFEGIVIFHSVECIPSNKIIYAYFFFYF